MANPLPPPIQTLTDRAYGLIEEDIVTLALPPGAEVSEAMLSARMGIGRTPIREALQRLAREQLVYILPRRGIVVSTIDPAKQLRLIETRRELERLLARSAALRATPAQRSHFAAIATDMDGAATAADDLAFLRLDQAFNRLLLDSCGNEFAAAAMALMNGLSRRFWFAHHQAMADLTLTAAQHARIARAIAASDPAAAAAGSDALIDYVETVAHKIIAQAKGQNASPLGPPSKASL